MINIGYFGDGPWASLALSHIVERQDKFSIAFITPRYDTQDPELKKWAQKLGVPFIPHSNVNADEFIEQISAFECDLFVSMSFNQILREKIINAAPLGFINCHAGALPFYRGRNPLNWVLINGEKEFGVTVHYVDKGIDTGDIITQNMVAIDANDDYSDLLNKAHGACAKTLIEALEDIEAGKVVKKIQKEIHSVGFYCGRRRAGDEWINWESSSKEIHDFVRAITTPGPGARTLSEKGEVAVLETRIIEDAPPYKSTSGEVVGRTKQGVVVKTGDKTLLITKVAFIDGDGACLDSFIPRWSIGLRLGNVQLSELHRLNNIVSKLEDELEFMRSEIKSLKDK